MYYADMHAYHIHNYHSAAKLYTVLFKLHMNFRIQQFGVVRPKWNVRTQHLITYYVGFSVQSTL